MSASTKPAQSVPGFVCTECGAVFRPLSDPTPAPELEPCAERLAAFAWLLARDAELQAAIRPEVEPITSMDVIPVVILARPDGSRVHVGIGRVVTGLTPEIERAILDACAALARTGFAAGPLRELG